MLFFVVLLLIWGANLGIIKNLDRTFFKIPVFSHKEQDIFMDIFMQSRLSCGAKCTELFSHCASFAWDEVETRCLLLASIFNLLFHNSSTQIGDNWEYYHVKGIVVYCHIYLHRKKIWHPFETQTQYSSDIERVTIKPQSSHNYNNYVVSSNSI